MKLYVIPVGSACNARCNYCITKFRKSKSETLNIDILKKILKENHYDKIEITGGGEPTLHKEIGKIINICSRKAPTIMYTNGGGTLNNAFSKLTELCISRAHQDNKINSKIMGIKYNINKLKTFGAPIKLSLMLHHSGINNSKEITGYLIWASKFAKKVVVRQLFDYDDINYKKYFQKEYVSTEKLVKDFNIKLNKKNTEENIKLYFKKMEVEFERRNCACENNNPVLYADGVLRNGWL